MSVNSKSMSKISDNASEGSFGAHYNEANNSVNYGYPKKKKKNAYLNLKKGALAT
jgi:hypothetical protein